ncbi:MAG: hypothetical protein GY941_24675 [Planctomycetes bacterium]|nr:hypothetical protein [Planctomycetota bacterium]
MKSLKNVMTFILFLSACIGCASFETVQYDVGNKPKQEDTSIPEDEYGRTYYQPRKMMHLNIKRVPVTSDLEKKIIKAKIAVDAAGKAVNEKKEILELANEIVGVAKGAAIDPATKDRDMATASFDVAVKKQEKAMAALEALGGLTASGSFNDTIVLKLLPAIADTRKRFIIKLNHSGFRDDNLDTLITSKGLLETVNLTTTDRTGEVVVAVAEILIEITKISSGMPISALEDRADITAGKPFDFNMTFDPTDYKKISEINEELKLLDTDYQLVVFDVASDTEIKAPDEEINESGLVTNELKEVTVTKEIGRAEGIYFRMAKSYIVSIKDEYKEIDYNLKSVLVELPNEGQLAVLPINQDLFTTTKYDVQFKEGMLVKADTNRPSQAMGIVSIPLDILKRVVALPTELIQLKIDYSSKQAALLENQKKVVEAQEALLKTLEADNKSNMSGNNNSN